jgi:hypothetical protein
MSRDASRPEISPSGGTACPSRSVSRARSIPGPPIPPATSDPQLRRGTTRKIYQVNQTIGSRFFQYYVGKQLEGPEDNGHKFFRNNHVLPFGYWIDRSEWVPVVHIGSELPDEKRHDPFDRPATEPPFFSQYNQECNYCHTTFPLGDMMIR